MESEKIVTFEAPITYNSTSAYTWSKQWFTAHYAKREALEKKHTFEFISFFIIFTFPKAGFTIKRIQKPKFYHIPIQHFKMKNKQNSKFFSSFFFFTFMSVIKLHM